MNKYTIEILSLDTIESSSMIKNVPWDNVFLKIALDLWFGPSNFDPDLVPNPEWILFPPIFTADILLGSIKKEL